jgi:hypothetical protein
MIICVTSQGLEMPGSRSVLNVRYVRREPSIDAMDAKRVASAYDSDKYGSFANCN